LEERLAVEAHLSSCSRCQVLRDAQAEVKALLRRPSLQRQVPEVLARRIADTLDAQDVMPQTTVSVRRAWPRRALVVGAIAATLVLLLFPLRQQEQPDLLAILAADVKAAEAQEVVFDVEVNDVATLRHHYKQVARLLFERTVMDMSPLGFHPVGGAVRQIGAVPATFTFYRDGSGSILCRRFAAGALEMPAGGEAFENGRLYSRGEVTIWIHQDHDATCCLVTTMPQSTFLGLLKAVGKHS
jgi:anti-sigma factor RsiW